MINERAMLVTLNISQWTGRKKDKKVTKETNAFYGAWTISWESIPPGRQLHENNH